MKPTPLSFLTIKADPPPHWLVVGNSAIIIVIAAVVGGWATSMATLSDPFSMWVGLVLLSLSLAVAILQYMAGFRQNHVAAEVVAPLHCSAGALFGFFGIVGWIFYFTPMPRPDSAERELCFLLCISLYCVFCGWMDLRVRNYLRWLAKTRGRPGESVSGMQGYQFTLRELMGATVFVAIMVSVAGYMIRDADKKFKEHITYEETPANLIWLPEGATDICYGKRDPANMAYEFTIDEAGFRAWAASRPGATESNVASFVVKKIQKGQPFIVFRYIIMKPLPSGNVATNVTITQGYYCDNSDDIVLDDIRHVRIAYDSANQRAYFFSF